MSKCDFCGKEVGEDYEINLLTQEKRCVNCASREEKEKQKQ